MKPSESYGSAHMPDAHWLSECRTFLEWLMDDHFIFLGVRDYDLVRSKSGDMLKIVAGSGLGILRETDETVTSRPLTSLPRVPRRKVKERLPLIITKTNARSTVGTQTEVNDYLRLLFARVGRTICEDCGVEVKHFQPQFILTIYILTNQKVMGIKTPFFLRLE